MIRSEVFGAGYCAGQLTDYGIEAVSKAGPMWSYSTELPKMDGLPSAKSCVTNPQMPILMLTAKDECGPTKSSVWKWARTITFTKPFSLREVEARINVVLRRAGGGYGQR